uniref:Plant heme peroxidase family profile domain-containing protein n=1 Tax=Zea mays TaxID=4577 RepID=B4FWA3_MAIZE|nr:unknown [Zea mays]
MSLLGPPARGAICLLVVSSSIVVLSTAGGLGSDATSRSAAAYLSVDDDYGEEDESGDSSFSFPDPETSSASTGLVFGFYDDKCPDAEEMVSSMVRKLYHADPNVAAALVRLFFHDCFIHVRLRRLGAAGPRRRPEIGARRRPEPVASRPGRRRGHQTGSGEGVPRDRLLRGHPGAGRAGQPRAGGRAYLPSAHGPPRQRPELLLRRGRRWHPAAERHLRHDARRVRAPRAVHGA